MAQEPENTIILNFENPIDLDKVIEFIANSCRTQEITGPVICTNGTLRISYEYESDEI